MVEVLAGPQNERNVTAPIDASARVRADAISALVVALDTRGRIALWNHACEVLIGYTAGEAIGRQVWDFLVPDDAVEPVKRVFGDLVVELADPTVSGAAAGLALSGLLAYAALVMFAVAAVRSVRSTLRSFA